MSIGRRVLVILLAIVLGSSFDLVRGYREDGTFGSAIGYAVMGWIVFGIPAFIWFWAKAARRDSNH